MSLFPETGERKRQAMSAIDNIRRKFGDTAIAARLKRRRLGGNPRRTYLAEQEGAPKRMNEEQMDKLIAISAIPEKGKSETAETTTRAVRDGSGHLGEEALAPLARYWVGHASSACIVVPSLSAIVLLAVVGGPVNSQLNPIWLLALAGCGIFFSSMATNGLEPARYSCANRREYPSHRGVQTRDE